MYCEISLVPDGIVSYGLPRRTLALMKTQNVNWLFTGLFAGVYLKYFSVMFAVSTAAT